MTWSFKGTAFRRMEPEGQAKVWPASLQITVDPISDSPTLRQYVDIGAVVAEPWSFRAGCDTEAARDALTSYAYKSGALITVSGTSYTALCTKATAIVNTGGVFYADLTFVLL